MNRATVVLPVPGGPVNTMWKVRLDTGRSRSFFSATTRAKSAIEKISSLTNSSPISSSISRRIGSSPSPRRGEASRCSFRRRRYDASIPVPLTRADHRRV